MSFKKFKENFNFYTNVFILLILFFGGLVWADTNGIWNEASDLRGGTIGSDEQDVTSNFTFINPVYFNENFFYKNQELDLRYVNENGTELDSRYVNEGQANSVTSGMIGDGQVNSEDISDNSITSVDISNGTITSSDINVNSVQVRVSGQCSSGNFIYGIANDGGVLCRADAVGSGCGSTRHGDWTEGCDRCQCVAGVLISCQDLCRREDP